MRILLIVLVVFFPTFIYFRPVESANSLVLLQVPFRYQTKSYYCGPACLEMVFAYYGPDISQSEIADVARTDIAYWGTYIDDMRRAGHFSNLSTSIGREMSGSINGYSPRGLGYATFERFEMSIDDVKALIEQGYPPILLMWQDEFHVAGHYRVAVGYNETHIVFNDPWNKALWGGRYGGANLFLNYSTVLDLWSYSWYWGMITCPWIVKLNCPISIYRNETFTVTANVTYPCPVPFNTNDYPAYSVNVTIKLPNGLALVSDENATKCIGDMQAGQSNAISWLVKAEKSGEHSITAEVNGKVAGSVFPNEIYPGYDYEDQIGGFANCMVQVIGFIHDVSVSEAYSLNNFVGEGFYSNIFLSVKNEGEFPESFNVTIYANTTPIAVKSVTLERECLVNFTFKSDILNLDKGNYTVWAYIEPVPGEVDIVDNTFLDGWLFVTTPGDVSGDFKVNILDCILLANHFGHVGGDGHIRGSREWRDCMNCDINGDFKINILDCIILSNNFS